VLEASTVTWARPNQIVWNRMFYGCKTRHRSALQPIADRSVAACAWWCWNAFFGFEDAVIENLLIALQALW